jgi:hypothetical protein
MVDGTLFEVLAIGSGISGSRRLRASLAKLS